MHSSFFKSADPFDVILRLEQGGGARFESVRRLIEIGLELGVFDGAKQFYGFHDFERGIVEFGVHRFHPYDYFTGELPPDAAYIQIVFLGEEGVGAYVPPPAERAPTGPSQEPFVDWNHNERPA